MVKLTRPNRSYPVVITDPKYARNQFMFNVTFVFEPNANTAAFEEALCKFCDQLRVRATCS